MSYGLWVVDFDVNITLDDKRYRRHTWFRLSTEKSEINCVITPT